MWLRIRLHTYWITLVYRMAAKTRSDGHADVKKRQAVKLIVQATLLWAFTWTLCSCYIIYIYILPTWMYERMRNNLVECSMCCESMRVNNMLRSFDCMSCYAKLNLEWNTYNKICIQGKTDTSPISTWTNANRIEETSTCLCVIIVNGMCYVDVKWYMVYSLRTFLA